MLPSDSRLTLVQNIYLGRTAEMELQKTEKVFVVWVSDSFPRWGFSLWSCTKSVNSRLFLFLMSVVALRNQYVGPLWVLLQCCTVVRRGTAASILLLLQYVQSCSMLMFSKYSVWPPGGAVTVCMPVRGDGGSVCSRGDRTATFLPARGDSVLKQNLTH